MNQSLRRAALAWMTGLLTAVGLLAIFIAYWYARSEAAEFLDGQLRQIALNVGPGMAPANAPAGPDRDPEDQFAITIWDSAGRIIHQSAPEAAIPLQRQAGFADVRAAGASWRVYQARSDERTVQVAQRDTVRAEIADGAAFGAAAPVLIVIPLSWLVVGWALNRALRPLQAISRELAARSASATEPVALRGVPSEVAPLVESMNGLIDRLRAAVETQKRFVADAAHELRTPLAAMQIEVDNLASGASAERKNRVAALAASVKRASALANQLLELARLDEPVAGRTQSVDLSALLLDCVAACAPLADRKNVDLGVDLAAVDTGFSTCVLGVESELRALLTNLIDNAVRCTPPGGKVDVLLALRDNALVAEIVDTGPGLPPGSEARIFDRFYRGASSDAQGTGLGLAIARRVAERHGLSLTVANRTDGNSGALARVTAPKSPSPTPN